MLDTLRLDADDGMIMIMMMIMMMMVKNLNMPACILAPYTPSLLGPMSHMPIRWLLAK